MSSLDHQAFVDAKKALDDVGGDGPIRRLSDYTFITGELFEDGEPRMMWQEPLREAMKRMLQERSMGPTEPNPFWQPECRVYKPTLIDTLSSGWVMDESVTLDAFWERLDAAKQRLKHLGKGKPRGKRNKRAMALVRRFGS